MQATTTGQNFSNLVALFLAEVIRSRRTSLPRAAEISQRVISQIKNCKDENKTLAMLTDIEKDFEEVSSLKQALHFGYKLNELKVFEKEIKEYASKIISQDLKASAEFLEDAALPSMNIQQLCIKYPKFCDYLTVNSEKAKLVPELIKN